MNPQLLHLSDDPKFDPDDWVEQLLASETLIQVAINYEAAEAVKYAEGSATEIVNAALGIDSSSHYFFEII